MTLFFKNHQITIKRARSIGGIKYALSATFTVFSADIQPQTVERAALSGASPGKRYDAFVDTTSAIQEGDKVVTEDGKQYMVLSVSVFAGAGLLDHLQLILEAQD